MLYSRLVVCEIRKIEFYCIDFLCPSPESKYGWGIHFYVLDALGLGALHSGSTFMSPFLIPPVKGLWTISRNRAVAPKPEIANPQVSCGCGAQRPG